MLRPRDIFKVYLELNIPGTNNLEWVEYTDGILNIDIRRGIDEYIGRWQYPDVGQLTLTSRNNNLDPEINTRIRNKRNIKVHVYDSVTGIEQPLFEGKINNVDVQYFPKEEKPLITLTAFDLVAELNNAIMTQAQATAIEAAAGSQTVNVKDVADYISANPSIVPNWRTGIIADDTPIVTPADDDCDYLVGRSYYDVFSIKSNGFLGNWFVNRNNAFGYRNRTKPSPTAQFATFSSDPITGELPFKTFEMVDGYERIYNSFVYPLTYSNGRPATTATYEIPGSIDYWGKRQVVLEYATDLSTEPILEPEGTDIGGFGVESPYPHREISSMTWDGMKNVNRAALTDINNNIRIKYTYGDISIDRRYGILGVQHSINPEEWQVKYILRNWFYQLDSGEAPVITSSATNTDNLTAVSFNITNNESFDSVLWDFGDSTTSTSFTPTKTWATPAVPSSTYNVTCTGTNFLGAQKVSNTIAVTVTGAAPIITTTPGIVYSDSTSPLTAAKGQYFVGLNPGTVSGFDTLSYSVSGTQNSPLVTKDPKLLKGPFIIKGTGTTARDFTLEATNAYGTSTYTWNKTGLNTSSLFNNTITARYIRIEYIMRSLPMYVYTGNSTWNDSHPTVAMRSLTVKNSTGTNYAAGKSISYIYNGNGNFRDQSQTWSQQTIVDPDILTDGNYNTYLIATTNLSAYSTSYPQGAGYRCWPNWFIVVDLGATYTDIVDIDVDFATEYPAGGLNNLPLSFPYKTLSTLAENRTGVNIRYGTVNNPVNGPYSTAFDYNAYPMNINGQYTMNSIARKRP